MKLQYLGDSKDAFKWDYLDFLARKMSADFLDIIPMKTPCDKSGEGKTPPSLFPASKKVSEFCVHLQSNRSFQTIHELPQRTGGGYTVRLHKPNERFYHSARDSYFSGIARGKKQILFLDPDIGFQPSKTINEKHVKYSDMQTVWQQTSENTIISVFQHARRMYHPFDKHYEEIKDGLRSHLDSFHSTAIFWCNSLMFFVASKSHARIGEARAANRKYQKSSRPVQLVDG